MAAGTLSRCSATHNLRDHFTRPCDLHLSATVAVTWFSILPTMAHKLFGTVPCLAHKTFFSNKKYCTTA
jgi:hypothetical protein